MTDRDLPEGVIDADPPGGWEDVSDRESQERDHAAEDSPDLITSDEPAAGADPDISLGRDDD
ncbi:MAG: hypothetical protein QM626_02200 [Microbacterium sp.]|uniref:hypothetical protein n=1 Tax=Microbacterium sp. TaxID=51671 RepID=UPI0039E49DBF